MKTENVSSFKMFRAEKAWIGVRVKACSCMVKACSWGKYRFNSFLRDPLYHICIYYMHCSVHNRRTVLHRTECNVITVMAFLRGNSKKNRTT